MLGLHGPNMEGLSQGLYRSPVIGDGGVRVGEGKRSTVGFHWDSTMPEASIGSKVGLAFEWHPNARHALVIGLGTWESTSIGRGTLLLPTQQNLYEVDLERRAAISYTEYFLGWRFNVFNRPAFKVYTRLAAHEIFDIDYRDELVFNYVQGTGEAGFRRHMTLSAQTASLLMGGATLGSEWFLRTWLSLGVEAGYLFGGEASLKHSDLKHDFLNEDQLNFIGLPFGVLPDESLGYLPENTTRADLDAAVNTPYEKVRLAFEGWQFAFRVNIFY